MCGGEVNPCFTKFSPVSRLLQRTVSLFSCGTSCTAHKIQRLLRMKVRRLLDENQNNIPLCSVHAESNHVARSGSKFGGNIVAKTCHAPNCNNSAIARGFCPTHYQQFRADCIENGSWGKTDSAEDAEMVRTIQGLHRCGRKNCQQCRLLNESDVHPAVPARPPFVWEGHEDELLETTGAMKSNPVQPSRGA